MLNQFEEQLFSNINNKLNKLQLTVLKKIYAGMYEKVILRNIALLVLRPNIVSLYQRKRKITITKPSLSSFIMIIHSYKDLRSLQNFTICITYSYITLVPLDLHLRFEPNFDINMSINEIEKYWIHAKYKNTIHGIQES